MKTFALIRDGFVWEIIEPMQDAGGVEIEISERFAPEFVAHMVDMTNLVPAPGPGWGYVNKVFVAPATAPVPTAAQVLVTAAAAMTTALQGHMDAQAQARGYDNLLSAISYADEPAVSAYQADGLAFRSYRSKVWAKCHELLVQVEAGTLPIPTIPDLLAMLPKVAL